MTQCRKESSTAYAKGDRAGAKGLSDQGKAHKVRMEDLNLQASKWIFDSTSLSLFVRRAFRDALRCCALITTGFLVCLENNKVGILVCGCSMCISSC